MSVKSMHTALMEMAQNQLDEAKHKWKVKIDDKIHGGEWEVEAATEKGALSSVYRQMRLAKHAQNDLRNRRSVTVTKVGTNESVELDVERAAWVPDTIADEQVKEFMEAAITSMLEGADTFMFEGKHYKTKKKSEAKLDPVGQADADIDNDGDVDSSDKYLHKRRKAIKKSMKNDDDEDKKEVDEGNGLWANIHKKRKEGRPMRKPGEKGAPTKDDFKKARGEQVEEATAQTGKDAATTDTFQKQMGGGRSPLEKQFVDMHKMEVELDAEKINDENKANIEKALKQTPARMGDNLKNGDTSFVSPLKADIIDGITKALQQMKTNN